MPDIETRKGNILIIDDELGPRESIRMVLGTEYNCLVAQGGEHGLKILGENPIDIVILDIRMPGIDGIETLKRIKETRSSAMIILLTGFGTLETAQKAIRLGAFDYLKKPFDIQELRGVVSKALKKKSEFENQKTHLDELEKMVNRWEQEMPKIDRMSNLGELSSTIVHEMKNPLTVILGYTQMILKSIKRDAGSEDVMLTGRSLEHLQVIEKETMRCAEIAMNLLKVSKFPNDDFVKIDIQDMLRDTEALILPQCTMNQIIIKKELQEKPLYVNVIKGRIHDILLNLCINSLHAIQATKKTGTITLRSIVTTRTGTELEALTQQEKTYLDGQNAERLVAIEIQDTGAGIPDVVKNRIFDHLFTTKESGTGIGLHVAKENALKNNGNLSLVRTGSEGTTFRLILPLM